MAKKRSIGKIAFNVKSLKKGISAVSKVVGKMTKNPLFKMVAGTALTALTGGTGLMALKALQSVGKLSNFKTIIGSTGILKKAGGLVGLDKMEIIKRTSALLKSQDKAKLPEILSRAKMLGFDEQQTNDILISKKMVVEGTTYNFQKSPGGIEGNTAVKTLTPEPAYQQIKLFYNGLGGTATAPKSTGKARAIKPAPKTDKQIKAQKEADEFNRKKLELKKQLADIKAKIDKIEALNKKNQNLKLKQTIELRIENHKKKYNTLLKKLSDQNKLGVVPIVVIAVAGAIAIITGFLTNAVNLNKEVDQTDKMLQAVKKGLITPEQAVMLKAGQGSGGGLLPKIDLKKYIPYVGLAVAGYMVYKKFIKKDIE